MQKEMTISIVLHGKLHRCFHENLYRFYSYAKDLLREVGVSPTHIGIHGQSFKSGKINVIKKIEAKLIEAIEKKEEILALSIYSLPENYSLAAFDYVAYISLENVEGNQYMLLATFKEELYTNVKEIQLIEELKKYIVFESGEIFRLSNLESPQIYASKANSVEVFTTLEIIKTF